MGRSFLRENQLGDPDVLSEGEHRGLVHENLVVSGTLTISGAVKLGIDSEGVNKVSIRNYDGEEVAYFNGYGDLTTSGTIKGKMEFMSNSSGYDNITDKPTELSDINSTEGSKLTSIDEGADVTNYSDTRVSNNKTENGITTISRPGGAVYSGGSSVTGAIVITLPQSWTDTMMKFVVDVFFYTTGKSFSLDLAGYTYTGGETWFNTTANLTGSTAADNRVRFGHDGSKCCIVIGEADSIWKYPKISVRDFQSGFGNFTIDNWDDGWAISILDDLTGYTFTADHSDALIDAAAIKNQGDLAVQNRTDLDYTDGADVTAENTAAKVAGQEIYRISGYGYGVTGHPIIGVIRNEEGTEITGLGGNPRSYTLSVYDRSSKTWDSFTTYDVFDDADNAALLATALNNLDNDKIIVVVGAHAPERNRTTNNLPDAIYRCGGSKTVFENENWAGQHPVYILVGVPGMGEGTGLEHFAPASIGWLDVKVLFKDEGFISGGNTPRNISPSADVTGDNTAADTSAVNGLASTTLIDSGYIGTNLVKLESIINFAAGDLQIAAANTERSAVFSEISKKTKEIYSPRNGVLRIKFDGYRTGAVGEVSVYRNGAAVGSVQIMTGSYVTYSQDISGWSAGDLIQLYITNVSDGYMVYVKNFRIYALNSLGMEVILD